MTFAQIEAILRSNHFYPKEQRTGKAVSGLIVTCRAQIRVQPTADRIREILAENGAKYFVAHTEDSLEILITRK